MMEDEVTQEELERFYHFGQIAAICGFHIDTEDNIDIPGEDIDRAFQKLRQEAQVHNIVLPEHLPAERSERLKTFREHLSSFNSHFQGKNKHLGIAFRSGILLETLRHTLSFSIADNRDDEKKRGSRKQAKDVAIGIQVLAQRKGIDIEKELNTIVNCEIKLQEMIDINSIVFALKSKFCSLPTNEVVISMKRSEIDPTRMISNEYWVVSLVRLPDKDNDQHAFLVLEAKKGIHSKMWFIDFVATQGTDLLLPGIRDGKVRISSLSEEGIAGSSNKLLFKCQKPLMDVQPGDRLLYTSWPIPKRTAEFLIQNVNAQQEKPPKYNILGDSMLAGSSATSSSKDIGHNCFTFARKMLHDLNDPYIKLPADKLGDWVFSATSRFLVDHQFERHKRQMSRFPIVFAFLAGAVVSYIILRLLS